MYHYETVSVSRGKHSGTTCARILYIFIYLCFGEYFINKAYFNLGAIMPSVKYSSTDPETRLNINLTKSFEFSSNPASHGIH